MDTLRVDARNNRDRIVETARRLFAARGLDVTLTEIARRSGVGIATLYRRFPTREALVREAFAEQFALCSSVVHDALDDPDPWRAFCSVVEEVCVMQAEDRGFTAAFVSAFPDAIPIDHEHIHVESGFAELAQRAKDAGKLRADFGADDLALLLMANSGIVARSPEAAVAASRRLVAFLLHSFRADLVDPDVPLPPVAPLDLRHVVCPPGD
ncbi:helix-turn-helix domain-containing protein [Umezawaea sp. Da 62-37]|uniref:TetR/AcrR family transcriptional regulator n=1 Tax=Umezawaea sp. Da 62-37 TaxID=3075927 RepID=UPI0028F6DB4A|nr:helix-turn-helix domain-containing protein [Umezawaea sp. Da 62-37]WNV86404.1 helix-turn-helix domain-containing protein [Umezawaea sp. Da 62-37]